MTLTLDWREPEHWSRDVGRCRACGQRTRLLDDDGVPCHKTCAETEQDRARGQAAAA